MLFPIACKKEACELSYVSMAGFLQPNILQTAILPTCWRQFCAEHPVTILISLQSAGIGTAPAVLV